MSVKPREEMKMAMSFVSAINAFTDALRNCLGDAGDPTHHRISNQIEAIQLFAAEINELVESPVLLNGHILTPNDASFDQTSGVLTLIDFQIEAGIGFIERYHDTLIMNDGADEDDQVTLSHAPKPIVVTEDDLLQMQIAGRSFRAKAVIARSAAG